MKNGNPKSIFEWEHVCPACKGEKLACEVLCSPCAYTLRINMDKRRALKRKDACPLCGTVDYNETLVCPGCLERAREDRALCPVCDDETLENDESCCFICERHVCHQCIGITRNVPGNSVGMVSVYTFCNDCLGRDTDLLRGRK